MDFPAYAMMQFFENHALLNTTGQHQWYTVQGGSVEYVRRVEASLRAKGVDLRLGCPVQAIRRNADGVEVRPWGGEWESFDEVVLATHSDDSLAMLSDASPREKATLGAIAYQPNDVVLHSDETVMPIRRKVWASWNYIAEARPQSDRIDLTYWMNSLQPIPMDDPLFVTLNTRRTIRQDLIHDQVTLRHPVYDLGALAAQKEIHLFNGTNRTWFCGAWMRHGFHEDGLSSAVEVADAIRRTSILPVAAA
jgi:predicted NAD/FAD-binding protein